MLRSNGQWRAKEWAIKIEVFRYSACLSWGCLALSGAIERRWGRVRSRSQVNPILLSTRPRRQMRILADLVIYRGFRYVSGQRAASTPDREGKGHRCGWIVAWMQPQVR
jgi:hypothetical protein